jgi:hypothetical protein
MKFKLLPQDPYVNFTDFRVQGTIAEFRILVNWIEENCKYYTSINDEFVDSKWKVLRGIDFDVNEALIRFESRDEAIMCKIALA